MVYTPYPVDQYHSDVASLQNDMGQFGIMPASAPVGLFPANSSWYQGRPLGPPMEIGGAAGTNAVPLAPTLPQTAGAPMQLGQRYPAQKKGKGGVSPDMLNRRRQMAAAFLQQGMDTSPIVSPWQGAARLADALVGGLSMRRADQQEQAARDAANAQFMQAIQGGQMTPEALGSMISDPWASQGQQALAAHLYEQQNRPPTTQVINGRLYRIDPNSGAAEDISPPGMQAGYRPATPEEKAAYGVDPSQPLMIDNATGKPSTLGGQQIQINMGGGGQTSGGVTGEEALKGLDPQVANLVKGIAEGRINLQSYQMRQPYWQKILQIVTQYDPSFDQTNYGVRFQTRKAYGTGQQAQNITSFNTAIGHLDNLQKSIEDLHNTSYPAWNAIANQYAYSTGNKDYQTALRKFETYKSAVASELTRAFRGAGGAEADVRNWEAQISAADSPEALNAAVRGATDLLKSRIEAQGENYNRAIGATPGSPAYRDPLDWLDPKARETFQRLENMGNSGDQGNAAPDLQSQYADYAAKAQAQGIQPITFEQYTQAHQALTGGGQAQPVPQPNALQQNIGIGDTVTINGVTVKRVQ